MHVLRDGGLRTFPGLDTPERVFEKVVRLAGPAEISTVWVNGRRVSGHPDGIPA